MSKPKKTRVAFHKNRHKKGQRKGLKPGQLESGDAVHDLPSDERMSGKGELTRYRTILTTGDARDGSETRVVNESQCLKGRVLVPRGANCLVQTDDGANYDCVVRRVVRTMARDDRNAVVAGDMVLFKPDGDRQGFIERVEPRYGILSRQVRGRRHVLVANVDQVLIVNSASEPRLKPSLIDRFLISAQLGGIVPIICITKVDLVDVVELQPVIGMYSQLGYHVVAASNHTGYGIARLRQLLRGKTTALAGQSGVGKSSLINSLEPQLDLRTFEVSEDSGKGRHTTTHAALHSLSIGGWVVDTPGVRQLELWDVIPEEVEGYFVEFHPFVALCKFPNCSHIHEKGCGVRTAVRRGMIPWMRYESYWRIRTGDST